MTDKMYILLDQTLFFIQGIQITFIYYYGMKPRRAGRIIAWLIVSVLIYSGSVLLKEVLGLNLAAYSAGMLAVNCMAVRICYKGPWKEYLKWLAAQYSISFCAEVIVVAMIGALRETEYMELYLASEITVSTKMIASILYMTEVSIFLMIHWSRRRKELKSALKLLWAVPAYQMLLYAGYFFICLPLTPEKIITGYFYAVFGIVLDCIILAVVDNTEIRQNKETELAELENLRKRELQYIEYDRHRREEIYSIRHELGNQIQILIHMLEYGTENEKI